MTAKEYMTAAQRTSNTQCGIAKLKNGIMGLCGESGECIDLLKKLLFQGHELNRTKMIEELGDVMWYVVETCVGLDIDLEQLFDLNIAKLERRYPNGFEASRSVNRDI